MQLHLKGILLLIEDKDLRQLYHAVLTDNGWEVIIAHEVTQGLMALVSYQIQLIIVDSNLKRQSVSRFLDILANKSDWNKLPLLVLDIEDCREELDLGRFPRVTKLNTNKITPDMLVALVKQMLNK
jgi:DNA-binding response OmpR family regulator